MPMPRSAGSSHVTFLSPIQIWPALMSSSPAMAFRSVDLPQPDAPRSTMNSPPATSRSRSSRTFRFPKATPSLRIETLAIGSTLYRARGDAAHEQSAGDEIDGERHEAGDDGSSHVDVVFTHALDRVHDVVELHSHRVVRLAGKNEAEQIVVPDARDLQDDGDREDRQRHRHHDPEEHAPEPRPIDARRLEELRRKRGEVVAEEQ